MTVHANNDPPINPETAVDYFLQTLVKMANEGMSLGVTLQVSGFLVSGTLMSGADYFDTLSKQFSQSGATNAESAHGLAELFADFGNILYPKPGNAPQAAADEIKPFPTFVHLRDARFFNTFGKPIPANHPVNWRGRISAVGGFSIGLLSAGFD